jgi:hypothetical protein
MPRRLVCSIVIGVAACGGGGGSPDGDPARPDGPPISACDDTQVYSHFRASPEPAGSGRYGSQAGGWVNTARSPQTAGTIDSAGGCRFIGPQPTLCTPACTGNDVCDQDAVCVPYPESVEAGIVTITGTTPPLTMESQPGSSYYVTMGYPGLFAAGDPITLHVPGEAGVEPFEITTPGIPLLGLPTDQLTAREHQDMVVAWTAVTGVAGAEVVLEMHNDHHAGPQYIECKADAAAGSLTVPAAILDQLILAGESGIGTYIESAWIEVRTRGYASSSRGCAAFDAQSDRFVMVETIRAR